MDSVDIQLLEYWIGRHFEATNSPRAQWIRENWTTMLPKFLKVFPHEYKRVLGIARQKPSDHAVPLASSIGAPASQKQVIHG